MAEYPEKYSHIDFVPPEGVQEQCAVGVAQVEQDLGGDGLEDATVREARAIMRGEAVTVAKAQKGFEWWARNERFLDAENDSPADVSANLWGGRPGEAWFGKLGEQMNAADKQDNAEPTKMGEQDRIEKVQIFKMGSSVVHPNGDFTVDEAFVKQLKKSWEAITNSGYRPPVLAEHGRAEDGRIYGKVLRLYSDSDGVYVDLELADGVKEEWERGYRGNVSPSIWKEFTHPHTGEELTNVLREVSMVSVPHLKNLKSVPGHYSLSEFGFIASDNPTKLKQEATDMATDKSSATPTENEEDGEEEEMDMGAMLKSLMERVEALEGKDKEMVEDDEKESNMSESERRIAELETKLAMSEVKEDIPGVKADELTELAELKMAAPKMYRTVVKHRGKREMGERGMVGSAEVGSINFAAAKERARQAGCKPGPDTIKWVASNYPNAIK